MTKRIITILLITLFAANVLAEPVPPATNKDGSVVSGLLTADFDPIEGILPFPHNILFQGSTDLTLNLPPDNALFVALSAMDGFSTTEKWTTSFTSFPNKLDPVWTFRISLRSAASSGN